MNRREFLTVAGLGTAGMILPRWLRPAGAAQGAPAAGAAAGPGRKPNVIVILTDDLGYGDTGCYGADPRHMRTPHIDRLAREGVRFTDGHSASAVCTPSRCSLLSGEYAFRNPKGWGILSGAAPLSIPPGSFTLPALFQKNGYATALVGKWHLGLGDGGEIQWNGQIKPGPLEIGFDEAFFIPATGDRVPTVFVRNHQVEGLDAGDPIRISYKGPIGDEPTGRHHLELATVLKGMPKRGHLDAITEGVSRIGFMTGGKSALWKDAQISDTLAGEAVKFIRKSKDKPFFLYFATHGIHEPRVAGPRFAGKSGAGAYGDHTEEVDDAVGQVLAEIDRLKLAQDTLIVFSSDNGATPWTGYDYGARAGLNGHRVNGALRGEKGTLWEGGTRVPFIVRWCGRVPAGQTSPALVSQTDLLASLARLLDVKVPPGAACDSQDVLDALLGQSQIGRHEWVPHQGRTRCALRVDHWKWIDGQLFDLSKDLSESNNLAKQQPQRAQAMAARLRELMAPKKPTGGHTSS